MRFGPPNLQLGIRLVMLQSLPKESGIESSHMSHTSLPLGKEQLRQFSSVQGRHLPEGSSP